MADLKIGVIGAAGRMGRMLIKTAFETEGCSVVAACGRAGSPLLGCDAGELAGVGALGVKLGDDADALFRQADAVLEFSGPAATVEHAGSAARHGKIHVIGTTGLDAAQDSTLAKAGERATIVYAPNMSVAVTLLMALVEQTTRVLGPDYDIEILEMHHKHKVDAPSGTAIGLGRSAARGRGVDLDSVARWTRHGHTGPRKDGEIGFAVLRGADVVSDHTVLFAGDAERLEFRHLSTDRRIFARGAVRAALWAKDRPAGLYGMKDVLGLTG